MVVDNGIVVVIVVAADASQILVVRDGKCARRTRRIGLRRRCRFVGCRPNGLELRGGARKTKCTNDQISASRNGTIYSDCFLVMPVDEAPNANATERATLFANNIYEYAKNLFGQRRPAMQCLNYVQSGERDVSTVLSSRPRIDSLSPTTIYTHIVTVRTRSANDHRRRRIGPPDRPIGVCIQARTLRAGACASVCDSVMPEVKVNEHFAIALAR